MGSYSHDASDSGLDIVRLQNDVLEVTIVPAAGGKILELIDRRSGRNWLWRNAHIPLSAARRGADFERELDSGGWDEILLSMKPAVIDVADQRAKSIPDHGDLICSDWVVDDLRVTEVGDVLCTMTAQGDSAEYSFERRIRLPKNSAAIEIDYRLTNNGDVRLPEYWCAHPLIAIEADARIEIDGQMLIRIDDAATQELCDANTEQRWPNMSLKDGSTVDLAQSFASNGLRQENAIKIYVNAPDTGVASVRLANSSERLTLRFDPSELPWLGLWINNGAWSGCDSEPYTNLGIEPATVPYDCINQAIENDAVPWLEPGAERSWSISVELQA